jgi:hypothetical protein
MISERYRKGSKKHLIRLIQTDRIESIATQRAIDLKLNVLKGDISPTLSLHLIINGPTGHGSGPIGSRVVPLIRIWSHGTVLEIV